MPIGDWTVEGRGLSHPQGTTSARPAGTLLVGDPYTHAAFPHWAVSFSAPPLSSTEHAGSLSTASGGLTHLRASSSRQKVEQQTQRRQLAHSFPTAPPARPQESGRGHVFQTLLCLASGMFSISELTDKS